MNCDVEATADQSDDCNDQDEGGPEEEGCLAVEHVGFDFHSRGAGFVCGAVFEDVENYSLMTGSCFVRWAYIFDAGKRRRALAQVIPMASVRAPFCISQRLRGALGKMCPRSACSVRNWPAVSAHCRFMASEASAIRCEP